MRRRGGSVILLLVLIGTAGLIGPPAAAGPQPMASANVAPVTVDAETVSGGGKVQSLSSGATYWQGQRVRVNTSRLLPSDPTVEERTFQLRAVQDDGRIGSLIKSVTAAQNGSIVLTTSDFSGEVVVQYQDEVVYVTDGVAYTGTRPGGGSITVENSKWSVERQTLTIEREKDQVYTEEYNWLTVRSNRASSVIAVSSPELNFTQLTRLFRPDAYASNHDVRRDEGVLRIRADAETEYLLRTDGLAAGSYRLRLDVTDTTAVTSTSLIINEPSNSIRFIEVEETEHAGDIVNATVRCEECFLIVGGKRDGLVDVIKLTDTTGDGRVTLAINTRYVGLYLGAAGVPSDARPYDAGDDEYRRYGPGASYTSDFVASGLAISDLREEMGLNPLGPPAPVQPGNLLLRLANNDELATRGQLQSDPEDPQELVVISDRDAHSLPLAEPVQLGIEPSVVPVGTGNRLSADYINRSQTQRDSVALGDRLVLRVRAAGIYGHLREEHGNSVTGIVDNAAEGIDFEMKLAEADANSPNSIDITASAEATYILPEADEFLVVFNTGDLTARRPVEPGERYRVSFTLQGIASTATGYNVYGGSTTHAGYPYLDPGKEVSLSRTIQFVVPTAMVTEPNETPLRLPVASSVEIAGTTNIAPGSILRIILKQQGADTPWIRSVPVEVQENGTWVARFEFGNVRPGDEFQLRIIHEGRTLGTAKGRVVEPVAPTDTATSTQTATTGTQTTGPTTSGTSTQTLTLNGTTDTSGPGSEIRNDGLLSNLSGLPVVEIGAVTGFLLVIGGAFYYIRSRYP